MADEREFLIKITGDASGIVAAGKEGAGALKEVNDATKQSVPVTEEASDATNKLGLSHRELHMALAQLGPEFAHMGGMAQYALHNQMLGPVLGIVGAFALWEHRINACVEALGGVELPDNVREQVGQIGALAQSWKTFNDAMMDAVTAYNSVDGASKRTVEQLKAEEQQKKTLLEADKKLALSELERQKALLSAAEYEARKAAIENRYEGQEAEDSDEARLKRLQEKADRGAKLTESSKQKMADAAKIRLGAPEQEAAIDDQMRLQAEAAEKSKKERQERLNDLFAQKDHLGSPIEQLARYGRLVGRYGLPGADDTGLDESIALEKSGGESEQTVIDRYNQRMKGKAGRDELQERRKKLVADAGKEAAEAYRIGQEGPDDVAAYQRSVDNRRAVAATSQQAQRNAADAKTLESPEGKLIRDVSEAESILQHGGQISIGQQSEIKTLAEQMTQGHIQQGEVIIQALGKNYQNTEALTSQVLDLARKLDAQGKQIRNLAGPA